MFYAHFVLSKKGPLARIWLAAHWDKKLTKAHIFETSIEGSVEAIMQPQVKLALRTSGHLLLGVVRIYSRKAKYLLDDCNAAIIKIKMAFRPGAVDLPQEGREAAVSAVTLPENFHEFDSFLPPVVDFEGYSRFAVHQSQPEEITLREDPRTASFFIDDDFGDLSVEGMALPEARTVDLGLYARSERIPEPFEPRSVASLPRHDEEAEQQQPGEDVPMEVVMEAEAEEQRVPRKLTVDDNGNVMTTAAAVVAVSSRAITPVDPYSYEAVGADETMESDNNEFGGEVNATLFGAADGGELFEEPKTPAPVFASQTGVRRGESTTPPATVAADQTSVPDQTTIINNDAEAFALGPIDATTLGTERKMKKKRKLIIDDHKLIPSETMRAHLRRSADLLAPLELAPPTKRLMEWKDCGGIDKLFILPGKRLTQLHLVKLFTRGLVTCPMSDADHDKAVATRRKRPSIDAELPVEQELRRGTSLGVAAADLSRISTAPVEAETARLRAHDADTSITAALGADSSHISIPAADMSAIASDMSLAPSIPELASPAPFPAIANALLPSFDDDTMPSPMSFLPLPSPLPPRSTAEADITSFDDTIAGGNGGADYTAFDETLHSAAADITMMAEGEDENDVQILNRRSGQLLNAMRRVLESGDAATNGVLFRNLVRHNLRKQVAAKFHTLLVLKKLQAINVEQKQPFGDICVTRGQTFDSIILQ